MNIVFVDPSLCNTGVVVFDDTGRWLESLSIDTNRDNPYPLRLKKIEKLLKRIKTKYKPYLLIGEEGFTRFNKSTQAVYRARAIVEVTFWNVKQEFYPATKVRKRIFERGNIPKEQIKDLLCAEFPQITIEDSDQADALALALFYFTEKGIRIHA